MLDDISSYFLVFKLQKLALQALQFEEKKREKVSRANNFASKEK